MFDSDVVLIATPGFTQSVLQYTLSALAKLVLVCFQIGHLFLSFPGSPIALQFRLPQIPSGATAFDVQSIFIVAFQCNKNLSGCF